MTNEERKVFELALDWIEKQPEETPESKYDVDTRYVVIREIEAALAQPEQEGGICGRCGGWVSDPVITQPETPYKIGQRIAKTGGGISHLWSAVLNDDEIAEAERGFKEALAQPEQCEYPRCACDNKESCKQKAQPEQWGASAVTHPEYVAEQKRKTEELRSMLTQPEQEPVAFIHGDDLDNLLDDRRVAFIQRTKSGHRKTALYTIPLQCKPLTEWRPIETAPKGDVLLYCNKHIPIYVGRQRYGNLGEPSQDKFAWRCSGSGRYANPTHWMPLPETPIEAAHGIKE